MAQGLQIEMDIEMKEGGVMRKLFLCLMLLIFLTSLSAEIMIIHTISGDFEFNISEINYIDFGDTVSVEDFETFFSKIPIRFLKNYPNPFNPETVIQFELTQTGKTKVEIYNIKGQKVKTLIDKELDACVHNIVWSGKDDNEKRVASGVYLYKVSVNDQEKINKMILIK